MAEKIHGLLAMFDSPGALTHAAEGVRDAGYRDWDCITPFPIHGLDKAMGMPRSKVPRISLVGGITGFCTGMVMIWYVDKHDYPLTVGGKPFFSPLFAFPVSYELTILFTAFATIGGMLLLNGLPRHHHPVLNCDKMKELTDEKFAIVIERVDARYNPENTRAFLSKLGATSVTEIGD
jgi:hypothetical protein